MQGANSANHAQVPNYDGEMKKIFHDNVNLKTASVQDEHLYFLDQLCYQ